MIGEFIKGCMITWQAVWGCDLSDWRLVSSGTHLEAWDYVNGSHKGCRVTLSEHDRCTIRCLSCWH